MSDYLAERPSPTLVREVYDRVKRDILTCRRTPGQMLYESELVERYAVSRTPVREALTQLIQEGLVLALPSIGHKLAPITIEEIRDQVGVRERSSKRRRSR